jgi:hypothetical protein
MIPCPYKYYIGIECLGCGIQRSFWSLLDLEIYKSFMYFPGLIPLIIFLILELLLLLNIKNFSDRNWSRFFGITALTIQMLTYLLRMLDILPWTCEIDHIC